MNFRPFSRHYRTTVLLSLAIVLGGVGCQKSQPKVAGPPLVQAPRRVSGADPQTKGPRETNLFLAEVPSGALGPRLAVSDAGQVAVWAALSEEHSGLYSMARDAGKVVHSARRVAPIDKTARQLSVGFAHGGDLLATVVHKSAGQDVLSVTRLGHEGAFRSGPHVVATTPSEILYSKIVATPSGALIVWVERAGNAADLYTSVVDQKGPGRARRLVREITAWQVAAQDGAMALVTREGIESPALVLRQVGDRGDTIGAPVELARDVVGARDLDVAISKNEILVAYSEPGPYHARLLGVLLDANGNLVKTPFALTEERGDQALLSVRADKESDRFFLAWTEPREAHHGRPAVLLGELSSKEKAVTARFKLRSSRKDSLLPLFAAKEGKLFALTDFECQDGGLGCASGVGRAAIALSKEGPTAKVVTAGGAQPPALVWDLACAKDGCFYLLSDRRSPPHVYLGEMDPVERLPDLVAPITEERPRVLRHETLADVPELSELEGVRFGERTLLSWVSYFQPDLPYVVPDSPAPDGRRAPVRARLSTVVPETSGEPGEETVISYRARSLGGTYLVAPEENRGLLLWSALDQKVPQLFATVVDARGNKVAQKMLTRSTGEITDAVAVRVPGGYLLSWMEAGGKVAPRVLALRVSESLVPVGAARVVSKGAVSPSGVSLQSTSAGVACVWSDTRGSDAAGSAELLSVLLDPKTATPLKEAVQLTQPGAHAHSPRLVQVEGGKVVLAFLSESTESGRSSLKMVRLAADGRLDGEPVVWSPDADVLDFAVECQSAERCRAVAVLVRGDDDDLARSSLFGLEVEVSSGKVHTSRELLPLWNHGAEGVSPTLLGNEVYFSDRRADGGGFHLRRATLVW